MSPAVSGIASLLGVELTIALYLLLSLALSSLMVSELPMFSFKLKPAPLRSLWPQLTLIVVTLAAVAFLGWLGCSVAIAAYLLLSLFAPREA